MPAKQGKTDEVVEMIRATGEEWAKHWNAKDLDKLVAAYADDAVYLPPHHAAVHGREAIREYLKIPLSHDVTDLHFDVTYIRHAGELAYDVGRYTMTVPHDGGTRKDQGKYLTVWRREAGRWRIVADTWSSDLPPVR
jgi:uncharacterized protein (TIGR02246 family)